jgi:para-nitrobenzyl esterase
MSSYWVNFATRGDPNGAGLPLWPALQPTARERLFLGPKIEVGPGLDPVRVALFDGIAVRRSAAQSAR